MCAPLVRWLREEARRAYEELGPYRILDVGCGTKPYQTLFSRSRRATSASTGSRAPTPSSSARSTTFRSTARASIVLCNQVLEHCDDPVRAIAELRRVTAPGGRVLVSTHGVMAYHPSPTDYWRWSHAGLEKLFAENGTWQSVRVTPAPGTTACLGMIASLYLDLVFDQLRLRRLARPLVAAINTVAGAIDRHSARLREPGPGTLFANFHVVAGAPR